MKTWYTRTEEYELAPGLIMSISREDNTLQDTVNLFLKKKSSIGEVRRALRAGSGPRYFSQDNAATTNGSNKNMEENKE